MVVVAAAIVTVTVVVVVVVVVVGGGGGVVIVVTVGVVFYVEKHIFSSRFCLRYIYSIECHTVCNYEL